MNLRRLLISLAPLFVTSANATEPLSSTENPTASVSAPIPLWKDIAPGEKGNIGPEHDTAQKGSDLILLTNVSTPTITVYKPKKDRDTGACVVVCPGGGYSILSMTGEGTEICEWLNSIGVTAVLLKYRVPAREGLPRHAAAFQDGQRAIRMVRSRATEFGVDPERIGMLGFSAGGHLTAMVSTNPDKQSYEPLDSADKVSSRPDFSILIYPAYFTPDNNRSQLVPELPVSKTTPPAFLLMTVDDPIRVENVLAYSLALKKEGVPFETHVFPTGGHGYGLRPSKNEVCHWPQLAEKWLSSQGWLKPRLH